MIRITAIEWYVCMQDQDMAVYCDTLAAAHAAAAARGYRWVRTDCNPDGTMTELWRDEVADEV
jgi:hypothetical protein